MNLSLLYFPSAIALGALHALEPGHAKTLTAAYLIGTKGTKRDATLLGLSVTVTHSIVVLALSVLTVLIGREAFTDQAAQWLAIGSSALVVALGGWLLWRRTRALNRATAFTREHTYHDDHGHDHALMSDHEHARAHAADLPVYVRRGERPTHWQVMAFGAAGGLVPCPAAVSVMLLSLSVSQSGKGLILVLGFSLGLAITLISLGLIVVTGVSRLSGSGRLSRFSALAPSIAAGLVIVSGAAGLIMALVRGH